MNTTPDQAAPGHLAAIVACTSEDEALEYAKRIRTPVLYAIADLLYVGFPTNSPRKETVARAVVREARA